MDIASCVWGWVSSQPPDHPISRSPDRSPATWVFGRSPLCSRLADVQDALLETFTQRHPYFLLAASDPRRQKRRICDTRSDALLVTTSVLNEVMKQCPFAFNWATHSSAFSLELPHGVGA